MNKHIHNQKFQMDTFNPILHSELVKPQKLIWHVNDTQELFQLSARNFA